VAGRALSSGDGEPVGAGSRVAMSKRRKAREIALQSLYACEMSGGDWERSLEDNFYRRGPSKEVCEYATSIVEAVMKNMQFIDEMITHHLDNWELKELPLVDKTILRIALAELLYLPNTPTKVIINEAVEIANCFSSSGSGKFVNGVLDSLAREVRTD
jgi:N utilization substance protein B